MEKVLRLETKVAKIKLFKDTLSVVLPTAQGDTVTACLLGVSLRRTAFFYWTARTFWDIF